MSFPYTILANSISSNYSVLVHCDVPANNLKCAGGGCSALPASLSLPFACTLWWQPNVMALTPRTMETMTGGQDCTSASSIYHPDDFFFFLHSLSLLFLREKVRACTHYALCACKIQKSKCPWCLRRHTAPSHPLHIRVTSTLNN